MSHELWRESMKRLRAIAQTGLTYGKDPYDLERYEEIEAMALSLLVVAIAGVFLGVRTSFDPAAGPGRLIFGFEAVINRDYPVIFATLYFFTLLGLLMAIVRDLTYMFVDPRIDFEAQNV